MWFCLIRPYSCGFLQLVVLFAIAAATSSSTLASSSPPFLYASSTTSSISNNCGSLLGQQLRTSSCNVSGRRLMVSGRSAAVATAPAAVEEEIKLFYNPDATSLVPNEEYGIGSNGGFNQPIMCGCEARAMLKKSRGKADSSIYTIQMCIPKHALNLIFSFTTGTDWNGPYRLQFQQIRALQNKQIEFFNEGLAQELSKEGACEKAIFPDPEIIINGWAMTGNLTVEEGDRCNLNLLAGCMDPGSPSFDPMANVDDRSCPPYSDSESED